MIPESIDADPDPKDPNIFAGSGSEFVGFGSIEPDKNLSRWRIGIRGHRYFKALKR